MRELLSMLRELLSVSIVLFVLVCVAGSAIAAEEPIPTRWMAPPGVERELHEVWKPAGPFKVVQFPTTLSATKAPEERIAIVVDDSVYTEIAASLATYQADLARRGYSSVVSLVSGGTPEDVRNYLIGLYNEPDGLVGALLVGNVPYLIYEMMQDWGSGPEYEDFPCDIFFMDMDGTWVDDGAGGTVGAGNGKYDGWSDASNELEIWAGRLYVETLPQYGTPAEVINSYFTKNHLYRTGLLVPETPPASALIYVDDDWGFGVEGWRGDRQCVEEVYDDVTAVYDDYGHGNNTTAYDYKTNHMPADYQLIMLRSHGYPGGHGFYEDYMTVFNYVYNGDYRSNPPEGLFYSLYVCSGCDYTAQYGVYNSYLGGTIVFNQPYGLFAWGSTKTGGMWNDWPLYTRLGNSQVFGDAFISWFNISHGDYPDYAPRWWYGMALVGDPALIPNGDYFPPAHPENLVAISGEASIDLSWQANTEPDLDHYNIYRGMLGEEGAYLATVAAPASAYGDSTVTYDSTYVYWVTAVDDLENESGLSDPDTCTFVDIAGIAGGSREAALRVLSSRPNPFSLSTEISFSVERGRHVAVSIYDVSGRCVRTLIDADLPPGLNTVSWDGRDDRGEPVGVGVYLCRLEADDGSCLTMKMLLLR